MHYLDVRRVEMLSRAYDFGLAHMDEFPADTLGTQKFSIVGNSVVELSKFAERHDVRRCSKASARWTLLESLEAFDRTANAIALDMEGLEEKFRVPWMLSDLNLLRAAREFAADAEPIAHAFLAYAMPETFIEDLYGDIKRVEETIIDQTLLRGEDLATMTSIDNLIESAMEALLHLDAIVANKFYYDDKPELAINWKCLVRYVDRTPVVRT